MSDLKKKLLFSNFDTLCSEKQHERYFVSTMEKMWNGSDQIN